MQLERTGQLAAGAPPANGGLTALVAFRHLPNRQQDFPPSGFVLLGVELRSNPAHRNECVIRQRRQGVAQPHSVALVLWTTGSDLRAAVARPSAIKKRTPVVV